MVLAATATKGFEQAGRVPDHDVLWLPGNPGDTYAPGDLVEVTNGVLVRAGDSSANVVARVNKAITCPAATQPFPKLGTSGDGLWGGDTALENTLVPVTPIVPSGTPKYISTFKNHNDQDVVSYVASARILTITTGPGADDDANGGLLFIYEGPGAGEWNIIEDTTEATPSLTLHRDFATAPTSASKIIFFENAAGAGGASLAFGRVDQLDHNDLDMSDGSTDGDWAIYCDAREIAAYMKSLTLPVIRSTQLY